MVRALKTIFVFLALLFVLGCSRKQAEEGRSLISIQAPVSDSSPEASASGSANKISKLNALPSNRKACYGVSISGPGIETTPATTCSPEFGQVAGFIEPGGLIEMTVPKGQGRKVELFVFLQNVDEDNPCPEMGSAFSLAQLQQTFLIGTAKDLEFAGEVETVNIETSFPGEANYLAVQLELPTSCHASVTPIVTPPASEAVARKEFFLGSGAQVVSGGGFKLIGRIGSPSSGQSATNSEYKIIRK